VTVPVIRAPDAPQAPPRGHPLHVLVTGTASDSHTWNLIFLRLLLEELGHRVTTLASCVPDDEVLDRCRRGRPDLVIVASLNGHGYVDGMGLISKVRSCPDLATLPFVIGGKLGIGGPDTVRARALVAAGFDAVFEDGGRAAIASLRTLLGELSARPEGVR
jgi:methylaspartate mutase sigma subunit